MWVLRRGSNEYPLSMLLSSKTKGSECPCKLHFSLYKVEFSSVPIAHTCLHDDTDFQLQIWMGVKTWGAFDLPESET